MPGQDFQRDRFQRPMIIPPGGGEKSVAYTRVTTLVGSLEDTYHLEKWKMRQVAVGLADRPDLILAASAHRDDKSEMDAIAEKAMDAAQSGAAATMGTAVHLLSEKLDAGEELPPIPEAYRADLEAYRTTTAGYGIAAIEKRLVHDELKAAGTCDRIYEIGGQRFIGDLKTSKSIDLGIGKFAQQLALYSRSQGYDLTTGERSPLDVDQNWGLLVHLPVGTGQCAAWWVDLTWGWYGCQLSAAVREYRKKKLKDVTHKIEQQGVTA